MILVAEVDPSEHALPGGGRGIAAEHVHLELFEVEQRQQVLDGGGHNMGPCGMPGTGNDNAIMV